MGWVVEVGGVNKKKKSREVSFLEHKEMGFKWRWGDKRTKQFTKEKQFFVFERAFNVHTGSRPDTIRL